MVIGGFKGAFDLAQAGSDTIKTLAGSPTGSGDTWQVSNLLEGIFPTWDTSRVVLDYSWNIV